MTTKLSAVDLNLASKPPLGGLVRHRLAQLVHQDKGGLVLDIEIAAELHADKPFEAFTNRQIAPSRSTKESLCEAKIVPEVALN